MPLSKFCVVQIVSCEQFYSYSCTLLFGQREATTRNTSAFTDYVEIYHCNTVEPLIQQMNLYITKSSE